MILQEEEKANHNNNHTSRQETTLCLHIRYPFFEDFRTTLLDCFKISNQTIKLILFSG